jgi:hypothetical protein
LVLAVIGGVYGGAVLEIILEISGNYFGLGFGL